jgi:hypothetical protein
MEFLRPTTGRGFPAEIGILEWSHRPKESGKCRPLTLIPKAGKTFRQPPVCRTNSTDGPCKAFPDGGEDVSIGLCVTPPVRRLVCAGNDVSGRERDPS